MLTPGSSMAKVEYVGETPVVVAEQEAELKLLDHGRRCGGVLILMGAEFAVDQHRLLLPQGCSRQKAARVMEALEQAALSHQKAARIRRRFRVI